MSWKSRCGHLVLAATISFLVPGLVSIAIDWQTLPLSVVACILTFPAVFAFVLLRTYRPYWPNWTSTVTLYVLAVVALLLSGVPAFIEPDPPARNMAQFVFTQQSLSTVSAYIYLSYAFRAK